MGTESVSFGAELKDSFKPVNSWVSHGIAWLDDIQTFYRERSMIEKEYSGKLNLLAKRYFEKKAKKSAVLSVGESPQLTPGSLESASLVTWTSILTSTENLSKEHETLAGELLNQVAEPLKEIAARYDDFRKRHEALAIKLLQERDTAYSDLKKTKERYDHQCKEVEAARVKAEKSYDASKGKAERAKQQEIMDMNNVKNTYLVAINVTNRQKEKYFHEDVPDVLNSLQDLNECRVTKLNQLWTTAASLESDCYKHCDEQLSSVMVEIKRNIPSLDSAMFIEHNMANWNEPQDFEFEPSMVWRDTDEIVVDDSAQVFLRNMMTKSRRNLDEIKPGLEKKRKEIESLRAKKEDSKIDESKGQTDVEVTRALFTSWEEYVPLDNKRTALQVEIDTILYAVGDLDRGASTHKFKSASFKIPTNCDFCQERIWGLGNKGYTCKDCGYSCHTKCEMKIPATCPGVLDKAAKKALKEEKRASIAIGSSSSLDVGNGDSYKPGTLSRGGTMTSTLSSSHVAGAAKGGAGGPMRGASKLTKSNSTAAATTTVRNRVIAPPPEKYISKPFEDVAELPAEENIVKGKMLYTYTATGAQEITVSEGKEVLIVEADDGSGWIKVKFGAKEGLVPATYVNSRPGPSVAERPTSAYSSSAASTTLSISHSIAGKKKGPAVAPKRGAKKVKYVEALYSYDARTNAEFSMTEGDKFVLVKADAGDGWAEVELNGVTKSVPANYIQTVD